MKAIKGLSKIVILSVAAVFLIASSVFYAYASGEGTPVFPHNFYGSLTIGGSPAPSGTAAKAMVGGFDRTYPASYTTTALGQYGSTTLDGKFGVDCAYGDPIDFYVNSQKADQSATCDPGADTNLDLTVTTSPTCTDNDNDGYGSPASASCAHPQADCNDNDASINPGAAELCDGKDNDCDGGVDEGFTNIGQPCAVGLGVCQASGGYVCSQDGLSTICDAVPGAPTGQDNDCNGVDENCDGTADNNYSPPSTGCGVGACAATGSLICSGGVTSDTCTPGLPSSEACSGGIDDDCDGLIDAADPDCQACVNGQTQSCPLQLGVCAGSLQTCTASQWPGCSASNYGPDYQASESKCDGKDNDCDGSADESFPNLGQSCTAGVGACQSSGTYVCSASGSATQCNAVAGTPGIETCSNGIDEDCDGLTDEGCQTQYCLQITGMRVLNASFSQDSTIPAGTMYNVEMSTYNNCDKAVTTMQIVQILKGSMPINLGTIISTLQPAETSVVTVGFIMPVGATPGTQFTAQGFNWNHWIDQEPETFEILSEASQASFQSE